MNPLQVEATYPRNTGVWWLGCNAAQSLYSSENDTRIQYLPEAYNENGVLEIVEGLDDEARASGCGTLYVDFVVLLGLSVVS